MAYTTINKSTDYFNTKLYTGTGSSHAVSGIGFQPDWVWFKGRNQAYHHYLFDAVRGVNKPIHSALTNAESTQTDTLMSFDSDGFTLGSDTNNGEINSSGNTFVSWNWKANGTGSSNTDGTITSTVSVNTTAGFSIVKYVGNTVAGATVGHGLGAVPSVIMIKQTTGSTNWTVYHKGLGSHAKYLYLDASNAETTDSGNFDNVPTSSAFLLGSNSGVNAASGSTYIAYCFAEKAGYSKFGSYTGNGSTDGPFCYTGFRPDFLIVKRIDTANDWNMQDTKRSLNGEDKILQANNNDNEKVDQGYSIDKLSNGFKCRASGTETNADGGTYIYMAFGQSIVGSNNVPATAR